MKKKLIAIFAASLIVFSTILVNKRSNEKPSMASIPYGPHMFFGLPL